jgi:hypothetical protein
MWICLHQVEQPTKQLIQFRKIDAVGLTADHACGRLHRRRISHRTGLGKFLVPHRLQALSQALLARGSLTGAEVEEIIREGAPQPGRR